MKNGGLCRSLNPNLGRNAGGSIPGGSRRAKGLSTWMRCLTADDGRTKMGALRPTNPVGESR